MGNALSLSWRRGFARGREIAALVARAFTSHNVATYASAISFRALIALVPLMLLGLALLGALGLRDVWPDSIAPAIKPRVTKPVFSAIDFSVERILSSGTAGLITFAALLLVWDLTLAVRATMGALNEIHNVEESRSWRRRVLVAVGLAVAIGACLIGAVLTVTVASRTGDGALDVALSIARWPVAVALLGLAVGLLVRYAPAERPQARWASAGSLLVIATWIVASIAFRWWVTTVADFKSAVGSLTVFLILTAYVFTSAAIFLVGVQLDELLRKGERAS